MSAPDHWRLRPASFLRAGPFMSFITELKRRKVFKVGGAYLVVGWLVIEVAATILPQLNFPEWAPRLVTLLILLGLPITLVLAWMLEITPEGVRADRAMLGSKRIFAIAAILAAVALGWYFRAGPTVGQPGVPAPKPSLATGSAAVPQVAARVDRGVAVLPFANFSPDPNNAFFASGIYDEVLTRVSRIDGLRVISRTSMEKIAGEKLEVPQIGRRLGVSHVLEGSVQRAGDKVRITVQLIEAATDKHIWAENYDRNIEDVFAIQSEIAMAIANQLKVALTPKLQATLDERSTSNHEAYDLYLRALGQLSVWRGAAGFQDVIALLEPAVRLDPEFLQAKVALVEAYGRLYWFGDDPEGSFKAKAMAELRDIERRWPDRPEATQARGYYLYTVERDYTGALAEFQSLALRFPNDPQIAQFVAACLKRLERYREQLPAARRVVALDPESPSPLQEMVFALAYNGRGEEAIKLGADALARFPKDSSLRFYNAYFIHQVRGDRSGLIALGATAAIAEPEYAPAIARAKFLEGDVDGAVAVLKPTASTARGSQLVSILVAQSNYLRIAGRDALAQPYARRALQVARETLELGMPEPGIRAVRLAWAAAAAALTGDAASARTLQAQAMALAVSAPEQEEERADAIALADHWLGDDDAAWAIAAPLIDRPSRNTARSLLTDRAYWDAIFGESAAYRSYMANLEKTR
ncbi:hypothetical protein BH11PSE14_BH11PSE14_05770 [soil metagenome]